MAKKQSVKFRISAPKGLIEFELQIKLNVDFRFFYATDELPKVLRDLDEAPHQPRCYFDSFHELKESVEKLIETFELIYVEESKSKVILYTIDYDTTGGRRAIDFRFVIVQKITTGTGRKMQTNYFEEEIHSSDYQKSQRLTRLSTSYFENDPLEMPWTKEREEWFQGMEKSIERLAQSLTSGFGTKSELLARKIDQIGSTYLLEGKS